jgi:DNA gyrase/topoisomerase IV subunit B
LSFSTNFLARSYKLLVTDFGSRVVMGDKAEPWREFIEKHALEVHNFDVVG